MPIRIRLLTSTQRTPQNSRAEWAASSDDWRPHSMRDSPAAAWRAATRSSGCPTTRRSTMFSPERSSAGGSVTSCGRAQLRVTGSTMRPPMKIRAPLRWTWTLLHARSM